MQSITKWQATVITAIVLLILGIILLAGLTMVGLSNILLLIPVAGVVLVVTTMRRPIILVVMIVFFIPMEPFTSFSSSQVGSINRYLSFLLLVVWLLKYMMERKAIKLEKPVWLMTFWFVFAILSYFWGPQVENFINYFFGFLLAIILMAITSDLVNTRERLTWILTALMIGMAAFLIIWFILGQTGADGFFLPVIEGTLFTASTIGTILNICIACFVAVAMFAPFKYRLFVFPILALSVYLFFAIALRRVVLSTSLVILALLTLQKKASWRTIITTGMLFLMVWYGWNVVLPTLPIRIQNRFILSNVIETGGTGRTTLYKVAMDLFMTSPLLGGGLGSFRSFALEAIDARAFPHNAYLEVLSQTGLIGFALWGGAVFLISTALAKTFKSIEDSSDRLMVSIPLALLVCLLANGTVDSYQNYRPFWFALGLALAVVKIMQCPVQNKSGITPHFPAKKAESEFYT